MTKRHKDIFPLPSLVSILQKYDYDVITWFLRRKMIFCFNSTKVRLWLAPGAAERSNGMFQFYKSTIMTQERKAQKGGTFVSILQKYDYDDLIAKNTKFVEEVSILQKYDYDIPLLSNVRALNVRFNSTKVRLWRIIVWIYEGITMFQFYKSTIMTTPQMASLQAPHCFNSTKVRLWPCHEMARILVKSCAKLAKNNEKNVDME